MYRYVNPRGWYRPDWMPSVPGPFSHFHTESDDYVEDKDIWRNSEGKVMILGFGITDENGFNDAFEKVEDEPCK